MVNLKKNVFGINLLTLFRKLDHYINVTIIFLWKDVDFKKGWVNLTKKSFMRLTLDV